MFCFKEKLWCSRLNRDATHLEPQDHKIRTEGSKFLFKTVYYYRLDIYSRLFIGSIQRSHHNRDETHLELQDRGKSTARLVTTTDRSWYIIMK